MPRNAKKIKEKYDQIQNCDKNKILMYFFYYINSIISVERPYIVYIYCKNKISIELFIIGIIFKNYSISL